MFKVGDEVAYGLHGKCVITAISTKELGDETVSFYQIRAIKNPIMAKTQASKGEAAILVPVDSASAKGLRPLMTKEDAEKALLFLAEPDYHFELSSTNWVSKQKMLEDIIRKEGFTGFAKVIGHLHILQSRDVVPSSIVQKFFDNVCRIFSKELGEALGIQTKDAEVLMNKALKAKLAADN